MPKKQIAIRYVKTDASFASDILRPPLPPKECRMRCDQTNSILLTQVSTAQWLLLVVSNEEKIARRGAHEVLLANTASNGNTTRKKACKNKHCLPIEVYWYCCRCSNNWRWILVPNSVRTDSKFFPSSDSLMNASWEYTKSQVLAHACKQETNKKVTSWLIYFYLLCSSFLQVTVAISYLIKKLI